MKNKKEFLNHIFIDVENVGCNFILLDKSNIMYYLVTHNSTRLDSIIELKNKYPFVEVLDVQVSGEQVADMAIYNKISKLYYTDSDINKFIVVSRDKGFVRFNEVSNIPIECMTEKEFQERLLNIFISMNGEFVKLLNNRAEKYRNDIIKEYELRLSEKDKQLNLLHAILDKFNKSINEYMENISKYI